MEPEHNQISPRDLTWFLKHHLGIYFKNAKLNMDVAISGTEVNVFSSINPVTRLP